MENFTDILFDSLTDAALDTLYLIPFLLVTYLIMEWIEHCHSKDAQKAIKKAGKAGPVVGALLGVVPQCGFSAAASAFYAGRVITLGTLFSVYLSTSDEMLPIFIAEGVPLEQTLGIIASKVVIGMVFGLVVDFVLRKKACAEEDLKIHEICEREGCHCKDSCEVCSEHHHEHEDKATGKKNAFLLILKSALIHTAQITLFIFLISFALNLVIAGIGGEETLSKFASDNKILSVFVSGLVGLIPNCAASVVIAQLYVDGLLGLGACMTGLLVSAGVGLLVLLRTNRPKTQSLKIIAVLYGFSVLCGLVICLFT